MSVFISSSVLIAKIILGSRYLINPSCENVLQLHLLTLLLATIAHAKLLVSSAAQFQYNS